ncbi:MAG: nicotinate-nucleotide adenylyltransferase [Acidobacteriota bacterium]
MKIGILGGTFDPIHQGHIQVARKVLRVFELDRILFMVARLPPHKQEVPITNPFYRYAMVALATAAESAMLACPWELQRQGASYTVDTMEHFSSHYPENSYCFIAGSDSLKEIHLWEDYDTLLRRFCFIFVQRPGIEVSLDQVEIGAELKRNVRVISKNDRPSIEPRSSFLIQLNPPDIQSTAIREAILCGHSPGPDILSASVLQFISKHRLYGPSQATSGKSVPGN